MERSKIKAAALLSLERQFGHESFRPGQLEALLPLLDQDRPRAEVISVNATASGKVRPVAWSFVSYFTFTLCHYFFLVQKATSSSSFAECTVVLTTLLLHMRVLLSC